jgi:hypothetical protein
MSGFLGALNKVSSVASTVNPIFTGLQFATGFFTSLGARKRRAREAAKRKRRAIKSENLLLGAAGNVVEDIAKQEGFVQTEFDLGQKAGILNYGQQVKGLQDTAGRQGFASSGDVIKSSTFLSDQFQLGQEQAALGLTTAQYDLEQRKESELRDIQSSLIELSAYSGRNINVLDRYNIS